MLPNNESCPHEAKRIMAWPMLSGRAMFVAPYCDEHAADIKVDMGGVPAAGPALSEEAAPIEGIHS
jgi:hypothetical protein